MNFALTEDQQLIRDAAARYLSESSGSAAVRAAMETATGYRDEIWQCIAGELGLQNLDSESNHTTLEGSA